MPEKDIHVIDSNVLIHSAGMEIPFDNMVTVPEVTAEMESFKAKRRFEAEDIDIREPRQEALDKVRRRSEEEGESLSNTDIKLLALALDLEAVLVTDDYWMQNLADKMSIECKDFLRDGIEDTKEWEKVCSSCGRELKSVKCPVCGSKAERRPKD